MKTSKEQETFPAFSLQTKLISDMIFYHLERTFKSHSTLACFCANLSSVFVFDKMKLDPRCSGYLARDIDLLMIRISDVFPRCKKSENSKVSVTVRAHFVSRYR